MSDDKQKAEAGTDPAGKATADTSSAPVVPGRRMRPCPICSKMSTEKAYPFCSKRCADVDLHHWLKGSYSVPVVEFDDIDPSEYEK